MKKCENCGQEFTPKNPKGVYCSAACRMAANRKKWNKMEKKFVPKTSPNKKTKPEKNNQEAIKLNIKRYDYSKMPKGLSYFQQLSWKEQARKEQDLKN